MGSRAEPKAGNSRNGAARRPQGRLCPPRAAARYQPPAHPGPAEPPRPPRRPAGRGSPGPEPQRVPGPLLPPSGRWESPGRESGETLAGPAPPAPPGPGPRRTPWTLSPPFSFPSLRKPRSALSRGHGDGPGKDRRSLLSGVQAWAVPAGQLGVAGPAPGGSNWGDREGGLPPTPLQIPGLR